MDAPTIEVRGLGSFTLTVDGKRVERWKAGKARDLLQFMLLRPDQVVPRKTLCDALWPDAHQSANTRVSLKVAVHTLRRTLDGCLASDHDGGRNPLRLATRERGYLLEVDSNAKIDFEIFDELVRKGHGAELRGSVEDASSSYREAAELYTGEFLEGVEADWARVHREWLRGRYLYALHYLANVDLSASDYLSVVRWCRLMIDAEPFCEDAYRALIVAHAQLGHLGQVRRWYQVCADRLYKELQTAPAPETERVYARALHGEFGSTAPLR